ncbi:MAG TPA: type II toxin-antitoxin system death-on-curing family toxin [Candidatus Saccharimonadales bacterium]|nr:type II toxin-antitoxin system death-on-curing family toxin [Candidatus Saccharimonadales bacterium]
MFDDDVEVDLAVLCYIHDQIIEASGGSKGFHNEGLIRSALARPNQSAFGEDIYADLFMKAAALLDSIANNHGFRDGNKRTAMAAAVLYLSMHNIEVQFTNEEYEEIMLHVVNDKPSVEEIKSWLMQHADIRA